MTRTPTATATSPVQFISSDVTVQERPVVDIQIGSRTYRARAPKIDVWRQTTQMLYLVERLKDLNSTEELTIEEKTEKDSILVSLSDLQRLEEAMITGIYVRDEAGNVFLQGGFLRRCLSSSDWETLQGEWREDQSELDIDNLFRASTQLQEAFTPWFEERENVMGLPLSPKVKPAKAKTKTARAR